jgi:CheY-like chemotaxis protein
MTDLQPYILIADDDPDDQEMLADEFRRKQPTAKVRLVANGFEALDFLRSRAANDLPQLMVIDFKMPGMTGAELISAMQLEERLRHIPKIVWSTSDNQEYIDRALKSGADKYFTKPSDMTSFSRIVEFLSQLFRSRRPN